MAINGFENEGTDLAADGQQRPYWETIADGADDTEPLHFSERVQFATPTISTLGDDERRKLEMRIWDLETALRILVGLAYFDECTAEKIIDVGRAALEQALPPADNRQPEDR
jgi:hypothetical protein